MIGRLFLRRFQRRARQFRILVGERARQADVRAYPAAIRLERLLVVRDGVARLVELHEQIRVFGLDVRAGDVFNALIRVVCELELADNARGPGEAEVVVGAVERPVPRHRVQNLPRAIPSASRPFQKCELQGGLPARIRGRERLEFVRA